MKIHSVIDEISLRCYGWKGGDADGHSKVVFLTLLHPQKIYKVIKMFLHDNVSMKNISLHVLQCIKL
jgi:hypothetical protein